MRLLAFLAVLVVFSGCICLDSWGEPKIIVTKEKTKSKLTTSSTTTYVATTSTTQTPTTQELQQSTTTLRPTTTILEQYYNPNDFTVLIAGCEEDRQNALIGGYVMNKGPITGKNVVLVTELRDHDGIPVDGGTKEYVIPEIPANTQVKFLQTYAQPPMWRKCGAYVK